MMLCMQSHHQSISLLSNTLTWPGYLLLARSWAAPDRSCLLQAQKHEEAENGPKSKKRQHSPDSGHGGR